jgi:hypothetical protein
MPEIKHINMPSIPVDSNQSIPPPQVTQPLESSAAQLAKAVADSKVPLSDIEKIVNDVLNKNKTVRQEAAKPKEPNWSTLTEAQAYNPAVYIPVFEHDIPDYMNMKLKDTEYEPVWASRDQRRLGQLLAEGYELLKHEHVAESFKIPLTFNSEGSYIYQDVICLRVHKRILFGKRRRALEISQQQLKRRGADAQIKAKLAQIIEGDPDLEWMFSKGSGFYEPTVI